MNVRVNPRALAPIDPGATARVIEAIREEIGADVVTSWFGRMQVDRIEGARAVVSVPTLFLKSWVSSHYAEALVRALRVVDADVESVGVVVRSTATRQVLALVGGPVAAVEPGPETRPTAVIVPIAQSTRAPREEIEALNGSPLDPRLTFATFHVGKSNDLAATAARQVASAEVGWRPVYNPLFLYGAVGLGKTHLLHAMANGVVEKGRRVLYLSAEKFMYGFVLALKAQTSHTLRERLRDIDLLVIDDVQFLQGKAIGAEFGCVLDAMLDARKQIVVAADRPPSELVALDDRIRSRIAGGLVAEIGAPDLEVRTRILETRVAAARRIMAGFDVGPEIIVAVAGLIQTNGRDLDGAVNRLMAHAGLAEEPLTVATAELAIRDLIGTREPKKVRIEEIQRLVATHYNVSRGDIMSSRRTANVVRPRQIAMYLSKVMTLRSLPEIGRRFGGRDHTTVLHAVRKMERLTVEDVVLRDEVAGLKMQLEG